MSTLEQLIADLRRPTTTWKRSVVRQLDADPAATPALLAFLDEILADLDAWPGPADDTNALPTVLLLLARRREPAAQARLLTLLASERCDDLLGDLVTEDVSAWLYATAGGDPTALIQAFDELDTWEGLAALTAIATLAQAEPALIPAVKPFFGRQLEASVDVHLSHAARAVLSLQIEELYPALLTAAASDRWDHHETLDDLRASPQDLLPEANRYLQVDLASPPWWADVSTVSSMGTDPEKVAKDAKKKKNKAAKAARAKRRR